VRGDRWVAVGANVGQGAILTSDDTKTWTERVNGSTKPLLSVAAHDNLWVAVGEGGTILTSEDNGGSWVPRPGGGANSSLGSVAFGSSWLVVGSDPTGSVILTSTDGRTWTAQSPDLFTPLRRAAWNGSLWTAVGAKGIIATSATGTAWTVRTSPTTAELQAVTWSGTQWIAGGPDGLILTSQDALTWAKRAAGSAALSAVAASP
jgi:hypothetical protein